MNDENDPRTEMPNPPASGHYRGRLPGGEDAEMPPEHRHFLPLSLDLHDGERDDADVETMRGVLHQAFTITSQAPPPSAEGYRLVQVVGRDVSWFDVPRDPANGYAVLGAHKRCDLVLANDACVSPRHLIAIVVPLEDQRLGLRLIDLRTDLPSIVDHDARRRSTLVRGQFALRVGRHIVCGFPIAPPPAPGGALQVDATGTHQGANKVPYVGSEVVADREARSSGLHAIANVLTGMSDLSAPSTAGGVRLTLSHLFVEGWWTGTSTEVPLEDLDDGMVLGRVHGFAGCREPWCNTVSDTHLLLLRERGQLYAFDLASRNGTRVSGERIRRFRVAESGAQIELGKRLRVTIGR
jgi:hypothetical protein